MDIRNFISQNVYQQLSAYAARYKVYVDKLQSEMDPVSKIIDALSQYDEESFDLDMTNQEIQDLSNAIMTVFSEAVSVSTATGEIYYLTAASGVQGMYNLFLSSPYIGEPITYLLASLNDQGNVVYKCLINFESKVDQSGITLFTLLKERWSETLSESMMWYDTLSNFLSGGWTDVQSFIILLKDKIGNASIGMQENLNEAINIISQASSGGLDGIAEALRQKFSIANQFSVISNRKIDMDVDSVWTISCLNRQTIKTGLLNATQFIGQLVSMVGHPVAIAVGLGLQLTTKLIDKITDTITTADDPNFNDSYKFSSWYGDIHATTVTMNEFKSVFPKVTSFPATIDLGFVKILATMDEANVIDIRYYDNACFNHNIALTLVKSMCDDIYNITSNNLIEKLNKYVSMNDEWLVLSETVLDSIDMTKFTMLWQKMADATSLQDGTVNNDTMDSYMNGNNTVAARICCWLSLVYMAAYFSIPCKTRATHDGYSVYICPTYLYSTSLIGVHWDDISAWLAGTARNPVRDAPDGYIGLSPFELLVFPVLAQYTHSNSFSVTMLPSWEQMVTIKNFMVTNFGRNGSYNNYMKLSNLLSTPTIQDLHNHVIKYQNNYDLQVMQITNRLAYIDYDANKDIYNEYGWAVANGIQSIVRYYYPNMTHQLASFISIMGISITVAVAVGTIAATVYKMTRNKRQAKKYSEYNTAIEAYKQNPTKENFKAMKKTSRVLSRDIKFCGSSRYLQTLSTAQFGWGDGSANSTVTELTSLMQGVSDGYNSFASLQPDIEQSSLDLQELILQIRRLIKSD